MDTMKEHEKYVRTVIEVEVLTKGDYAPDDLGDVARDITHGDASGKWEVKAQEEVTRDQMRELLKKQGSDPAFLLGDEEDDDDEEDGK